MAITVRGWKTVRWREGTKGWLTSRFAAVRVQPSQGSHKGQAPHKEVWLLIEWPEREAEPTNYFFGDLPASYTLRRLVRLAKCRWAIAQDYHQHRFSQSLICRKKTCHSHAGSATDAGRRIGAYHEAYI